MKLLVFKHYTVADRKIYDSWSDFTKIGECGSIEDAEKLCIGVAKDLYEECDVEYDDPFFLKPSVKLYELEYFSHSADVVASDDVVAWVQFYIMKVEE